eukprot:TRINITY_DN66841_c0_g1_i1.p1 TRINITY_DN66841_c0_g1~~TRINITY_DN66841_c0_g1_i1.p1  ORF type:complete len:452 (-),score=111.17 TRINITY_DN66841_c0_g1_i1:65-1420(-)
MPVADIDYREYFPPEKLAELQATFDGFDSSGDGSLGPDELYQMFKKLGKNLTRAQLREVMKEVDTDGSGEIEFEELCILEIKMNRPRVRADLIRYQDYIDIKTIKRLEDAFVRRDVACRGYVTTHEFKQVTEAFGYKIPDEELDDVISDVDKHGTGDMDFDQFAACFAVATKARKHINYREFLTKEEVEEMKVMFDEADGTGSGEITTSGLDHLFRRMGHQLKSKQLKSIVRDFDADGSGEIDFEEFCIMMMRLKGSRRMRKLSPLTYDCRDLWVEESFTVKELQQSGFTVEHMKAAGIPVGQILADNPPSALEMRRCGYTAAELRKGGMSAAELRACGYSLYDLRLAGFSNAVLAQTNKVLRACLSKGNLSVLAQQNPSLDPRKMRNSILKGLVTAKWTTVPKPVTPRIREHTDWRPTLMKPSRPQTVGCIPGSGSLDLPDLPGRPMTAE